MNETIVSFNFDGTEIRALDQDGKPWFVAADVCAVLALGTEQTRRLNDHQKGLRIVQTPGGPQEMVIISESGLYNLIFKSRKKEAKQFVDWVTDEVLPQIRKTGQYTPDAKPTKKRPIGGMRPDNDKLIENYRMVLPKDMYHDMQDTITRLQTELIQSEREHLQTQRALLQSQQELLQLKLEYAAH